jgi:hypothetical protein
MYGLVNKAIEGLLKKEHGPEMWEKVKSKANFMQDNFISMKSYPDGLTYSLVAAASEELGIEGSALLEAFGEYWILYTASEGYGDMLGAGGNSLPEFLHNLNMLHFRLGNMMPEMVMPEFEIADEQPNSMRLIYKSTREGLAPMVVGIVKGLGKRFNTPCSIELKASYKKEKNEDHFFVEW